MKAITKVLAGGIAIAALSAAAPAAAQYYPGYGNQPYGYGNQPYGYGNGYPGYGGGYGYNGFGGNSQRSISQCVGAVQARLNGGYGNNGYGNGYGYGNNGYGYGQPYGAGRVLGISRVEPRSNGGLTVRGVANSGRYAGYNNGYGYNGQLPVDLTFRCRVDYRGYVTSVDINRAQDNYGSNYQPYSPYQNDYSQYGYRRY